MAKQTDEVYINLLSYKFQARQERQNTLVELGVYAAVLVVIICFMLSLSVVKRHQYNTLQQEIRALQATLEKNQSIQIKNDKARQSEQSIAKEIERQQQAIKEITGNRRLISSLYKRLVAVEVDGVLITNVDDKGKTIDIKGYSMSYDAVMQYLALMKKNKEGELDNINLQKSDENGEISFSFSLAQEVSR